MNAVPKEKTFFGHPRALGNLFNTEMGERASFYGLKAILPVFLITSVAQGGLGYSKADASAIYGWYVMAVYLMAIPGGILADLWLGARRSVLVGGSIIAAGHFIMLLHSPFFVFLGLAMIACGTGLLKPNISTMVGEVYGGHGSHDTRREQGFTLFYMGINIGAAVAPVVCGLLAQDEGFKWLLSRCGINPINSWHFAFGAAGVFMLLALWQFWGGGEHIRHLGLPRSKRPVTPAATSGTPGQAAEERTWKHGVAILVLCLFSVLFFCITEQGGTTLNFFAKEHTRNTIFGWTYPSTFFQSVNPICVILFSPIFALIWAWLAKKGYEPASAFKFAIGLLFLTMGTALMVPAAHGAMEGQVSPMWLVGVFALQVIGELCLSPVGLSKVTELAPARFTGLAVGMWFVASALAAKLGGFLAGYCGENPSSIASLFTVLSIVAFCAAVGMTLIAPLVRWLMKPVF